MKKFVFLVWALVPALLAAVIWLTPDNALSPQENRSLTTRETLSLQFFDGSAQKQLEQFLSDQFPLRQPLVTLQTTARYAAGQRAINGTYLGKNGRYRQTITAADYNENTLTAYADGINRLAEHYPVSVIYVPAAGAALPQDLPENAPHYDYPALYGTLKAHLSAATVIDVLPSLQQESCYYQTDHHWTAQGAYQAYAVWCRQRGTTPAAWEAFSPQSYCRFRGTLYAKAPLPQAPYDTILLPAVPDNLSVTADGTPIAFYDTAAKDYNVFQGGNHGVTDITNPDGKGKTLLLLKDSFANSFVPYLVGTYSRIVMLDERYTFVSTQTFAEELQPDEILVLKEITG